MEFEVNANNVILKQIDQIESGEYNITECNFVFSNEYDDLTKIAVFTGENGDTYKITILNNKCEIPSELLAQTQIVQIGVYAYEVQGTEFILRYSPMPTRFMIEKGSYVVNAVNMSRPTPTEVEQLQSQITHNSNDIEELQETSSQHGTDISQLQEGQTEQNRKIQKNTDDIETLSATKADKNEIPTTTSELINDSDFVSDANYVHTDNNFTNEAKSQIATNKNDIADIKGEQITQNTNIQNNTNAIGQEATDRQNADVNLQSQIDAITVSSDVIDVLGTYQDLLNYDTSHVKANDIIKVLQDSTHNDAVSYYRWIITNHVGAWNYVGSEGPYYTKGETNTLLNLKANADNVYTKNETYNKTELNTLLNDKVNKVEGKGLSTEDFTTAEKTKLEGIEAEANKTIVDSEFSNISENPVQNKVIYEALAEKQTEIDNLETDVEDLRNASVKVTGEGTDITLNNSSKCRLLKNELSGQTSQDTSKIVYICDGTETGDYYFTYNNINYQFTMPTVSSGDILVFNTITLVLSLNNTAITTETGTTGTELTFLTTPNPRLRMSY